MERIINSVYSLAQRFTENPKHVTINGAACVALAQLVQPVTWGIQTEMPDHQRVWFELFASSINYCFWYGRSDIRPGNACASEMYKILNETWQKHHGEISGVMVRDLVGSLARARFPLLGRRRAALFEVLNGIHSLQGKQFQSAVMRNGMCKGCEDYDMNGMIEWMVSIFPSFGDDMFLKRANLYFGLLYQKYGWFQKTIGQLPAPADYQVPKILRHAGVLKYSDQLMAKIENDELITRHSLEEIEIRASTIIACRFIAGHANLTVSDVDSHLWSIRDHCKDKFHLTITTDY